MRKYLSFWAGLLLLLIYWFSVRPIGFQRGYIGDYCGAEMSRQMLADQLKEQGGPFFYTHHYVKPHGNPFVYMSQSIEQTWLGAYVWNWNRDFPYLWAYFGVSLLLSYIGIGIILKKMGFGFDLRWALTTFFVVFHIPRHYVTWEHGDFVDQHWLYLGFFFDAWIWQRFFRECRWSWSLEFWRGLFLLCIFGTPGYFWGPTLLEWLIVRICIMMLVHSRSRKGICTKIEGNINHILFPVTAGLVIFLNDLRWFLPLISEARKIGHFWQGVGYHAPILMVLRPLWLDWILQTVEHLYPSFKGYWSSFQLPETVVTIGWAYWIPALFGIRALRKKLSGPGVVAILPFFILLGIGIWYLGIKPHWVQDLLRGGFPFFVFFRVASRWGLFLPQIVGILILLSWPELKSAFLSKWHSGSRKFKGAVVIFGCLSVAEMTFLLQPVRMLPPFSRAMLTFLTNLRNTPGRSVLDMPFCYLGGNGVCIEQCPFFPKSTAGSCFRQWHNKDVYGFYQSRLAHEQCQNYHQEPFRSWMETWGKQDCFSKEEWKTFCRYLEQQTDLAAILVYPDLWTGSDTPQCQSDFRNYLGNPVQESKFFTDSLPGGIGIEPSRVIQYSPKCRSAP